MNRSVMLLAAAGALLLAGCDLNKKKDAQDPAAQPAYTSDGPALGHADAPDAMPMARRTAAALSGAARQRGDDAGRALFDGAARRAGIDVPGESDVVYAPSYSGRDRATLVSYTGRARKVSDLGRSVPLPPGTVLPGADAVAGHGAAGKVLAEFAAFAKATYADATAVMSRGDWRAVRRRGSPVVMHPTHVTVHHTEGRQTMTAAETAAEVKGIQRYHMANTDGRHGWDDIGYHFLIDGAGRVVEGRPAETLGAHAGGANDDNIGVSVMGDFNRIQPTPAQVESLTRLVSFLALKYGQNPSRQGFLEPHKHYDNTDCPGKNMMAILDSLRRKIDARTSAIVARLGAAKPGQFVPVMATDA